MEQEFSSAGFNSFDPFENLFGFFLILSVFVIIVLICCLLALVKKIRDKVIQELKDLRDYFFWTGVIKSILITYLKNFASCYMAYKLILRNQHSESTIVMIIITGIILTIFPIWSSFLLF